MHRLLIAFGPDAERLPVERAIVAVPRSLGFRVEAAHGDGFALSAAAAPGTSSAGLARVETRGLVAVLDGRLCERDALARELSLPPSRPDVELALAAWIRFGREAPRHLGGDFALVVVEPNGPLFAARDAFGTRPLYFARVGEELRLASDFDTLFSLGDLHRAPDPVALSEMIDYAFVERERTMYAGVSSLAAGSWLAFERGRTRIERYYSPGASSRERRGTLEEAHAALLASTRDRVPTSGALGLQASGGLDSSLLAALVCRDRRAAAAGPPLLLHVRASGLGCDEHAWASALADQLDAPLFVTEGVLPYGVDDPSPVEVPDIYAVAYGRLFEEAASRGIHTVITGEGSDDLQVRWGREIDDALTRRSFPEALSFLPPGRSGVAALIRALIRVTAPASLLSLRRRRHAASNLPEWLTKAARQDVLAAAVRAQETLASVPEREPVRRLLIAGLTDSYSMTFVHHEQQRLARAFGVDLVHPFLDRRVAEAFLALPSAVRTSRNLAKPGLRRIAERYLPHAMAYRPPPTDYTDLQLRVWNDRADEWRRFARSAHRLADLGVVEPTVVRAAIEEGLNRRELSRALRVTLRLERWLMRFDARP